MQLNYLDVLYSKFLKAKGYNKMSVDSKYMNDEFEEWLERCSMQLDEYRAYLDYRRIRYNKNDVVEIGHGALDTVMPKNSKSLIITPYSNSFENKNEYNILDGYFKCNTLGIGAYEKDPKVHTFDNNLIADLRNYNTFVTQNPNDLRVLHDISRAHIIGKNILVCFYGNNCDADRKLKMDILKELKEQLLTDYKEEEISVRKSFINLIYSPAIQEEIEQPQYKKTI